VADLVREALVLELTKNGHSVVSNGRDVVLAATVEDFRLDEVPGYASTRYVGRVVIALNIVNGQSGEILLTRRYVGITRRQIDKPSDDAMRETMDAALARTMHDLANGSGAREGPGQRANRSDTVDPVTPSVFKRGLDAYATVGRLLLIRPSEWIRTRPAITPSMPSAP
jgi:hypothetical protein